MKLKLVEIEGKTYAAVEDGKPVYVDGDKDLAMDVPAMSEKIKQLGREAKGHREAKEAAEAALKGFDGIDDPAAALKALETIKGFDGGKLMDAEKAMAERKAAVDAATKEFAARVDAAEKRAKTAEESLFREKIGGSFARSTFISEKLAVPTPMVEATFGRHFSIEEGKIVAKDANGNAIYSKANPGEPATFDEALEALVESSPYRDNIMKGRGANGTGSRGGAAGGGGHAKTITREAYEAMGHAERRSAMSEGVKVAD